MAQPNDFGLFVGQYSSTFPVLVDDQESSVQLDSSGRLIISGRYLEDSAHVSGDAGIFVMGVRNDADAALTSADGDYSPIAVDEFGRVKVLADLDVDFDFVYEEDSAHVSEDLGAYVLAVRSDSRPTNANTSADGDYASFFINANGELYVKDTDLAALLTTIDSVLDSILIDTTKIASSIYDEDSGHTTADPGQFILAIRNDSNTALTDADLDYSGIAVDSAGRVKLSPESSVSGSEEYAITDAQAAAGDGFVDDVDLTNFSDLATIAVGVGETLYIYGYQVYSDKQCFFRVVTDDTTDIKVHKVTGNTSAMPHIAEHFSSEGGRIEIVGAANLVVKLQAKRLQPGGVDAVASGSIHARKI